MPFNFFQRKKDRKKAGAREKELLEYRVKILVELHNQVHFWVIMKNNTKLLIMTIPLMSRGNAEEITKALSFQKTVLNILARMDIPVEDIA